MARKADGGMFVPEAEQPYEIPQNWRWVRLSALVSPSKETTADFSSDIRYVGLEHMETGRGIVSYGNAQTVKSLKNVFHDGQILYGKLRPYLNKHDIADFSGVCSTDILVFEQSACSCARYVNYYFDLPYFFEYAVSHSRGIHLPRVTESILLNAACPLPPLAEQQRIVERIESLFTKLDAARENAQAVVDGFELRKAAILHRAFSGKLTKEWRKSNQISDSTWQTVELQSVCQSIFDGDHLPPPKSDAGIPFLVISNVNNGHLSFENTRFVPQEYYDALTDTRKPEIGDVLYTLVGSYGIPVVVDDARPFCFQRHMALIKPDRIDTYYLWYQLQGIDAYNQASEIATGSAQLTVPIKGLRKMKIALASQKEQRKIAKELAYLLEKDQQAKDTAQQIILRIDAMKKAILGRAFRGELGTNDPSEESPETLLRDLL